MTVEVIIPESTQLELQKIQSGFIQVTDKESFDQAVDGIRNATTFLKSVDSFFETIEDPLKESLRALRERKTAFTEPATSFIAEHRKRCADWKIQDDKRKKEEQDSRLNNLMPWEDPSEALAPTPATSNGAGLRNLPYKAQVDNLDELWAAAIADPRYREYFLVDMKALNAKARSLQGAFNIPGCSAVRGQTLAVSS